MDGRGGTHHTTGCDCITKPSPTQGHTGRTVLMVARQPSKTTDSCVYRSRVSLLQMCVLCATVAIATPPPSLSPLLLICRQSLTQLPMYLIIHFQHMYCINNYIELLKCDINYFYEILLLFCPLFVNILFEVTK